MFVQVLPSSTIRYIWRTLRRICILILGLKGCDTGDTGTGAGAGLEWRRNPLHLPRTGINETHFQNIFSFQIYLQLFQVLKIPETVFWDACYFIISKIPKNTTLFN